MSGVSSGKYGGVISGVSGGVGGIVMNGVSGGVSAGVSTSPVLASSQVVYCDDCGRYCMSGGSVTGKLAYGHSNSNNNNNNTSGGSRHR